MNAYELPVWQMSVDEVKALIETNRQQADRIAELEKAGYEALRKFAKAYDENKKLKSKLETHANIEPKTYAFDENADKTVWISTPQTKPLSDEEITDCADKAKIPYDDNKGFYVMHSNGSWVNIGGYLEDFARAIEAKVRGEK